MAFSTKRALSNRCQTNDSFPQSPAKPALGAQGLEPRCGRESQDRVAGSSGMRTAGTLRPPWRVAVKCPVELRVPRAAVEGTGGLAAKVPVSTAAPLLRADAPSPVVPWVGGRHQGCSLGPPQRPHVSSAGGRPWGSALAGSQLRVGRWRALHSKKVGIPLRDVQEARARACGGCAFVCSPSLMLGKIVF